VLLVGDGLLAVGRSCVKMDGDREKTMGAKSQKFKSRREGTEVRNGASGLGGSVPEDDFRVWSRYALGEAQYMCLKYQTEVGKRRGWGMEEEKTRGGTEAI
jgi:hypothetical protein